MGGGLGGAVQQSLGFHFSDTGVDTNMDTDMVKSTVQWMIGNKMTPRPTKLGIINLDDVLHPKYWFHCLNTNDPRSQACCRKRAQLKTNMRKALNEYAAFKKIPPIGGEKRYLLKIFQHSFNHID